MLEGWVAGAAIAASAVVGAGAAVYSADKASNSAKNAQNIAQNQYSNDVSLEKPYNQAGMAAQNQLNYLLGDGGSTSGANTSEGAAGSLLSPFTASMMQQYSPAYQFQLQQGRQGVLNGASSGQGGLSGAAMQSLTDYNQAEANTAFSSANNIYQQQQNNIYSRLAGVASQGQAAASGTVNAGSQTSASAAQSATNAGAYAANGITGAAGALGNGASTAALYSQYGGGGNNSNFYTNSAGQNVYSGVEQNGGLGGGVGNIVGNLDGP